MCVRVARKELSDLPRIYGDEFVAPQLSKNMFQFWINIDQKVLSAKIHLKEIIHTDLVVEIQDDRNQRCVSHRKFFEEFSIRPVRTGMNLIGRFGSVSRKNPPRAYGDAPIEAQG